MDKTYILNFALSKADVGFDLNDHIRKVIRDGGVPLKPSCTDCDNDPNSVAEIIIQLINRIVALEGALEDLEERVTLLE